ncbi:MAG: MBL fold metallo-hydrolase, partial [Zoogloeaceae bacterium]|nr:MBL fold metallo-hydrolase [Zoogloeaceae bacterium]
PVTPLEQNCTLFICEETQDAVVIDPGGDVDKIAAWIAKEGAKVGKILLTHGHFDHAGGAMALKEKLNVPLWGPHQADKYWLDSIATSGLMYGISGGQNCQPDQWLEDGDTVFFGNERIEVLHCPGHTPGHVVYCHRGAKLLQVGDVLFAGSIGRTDFPGGNHQDLIDSIQKKLFPLGDDMRFIPGHGPMSTLGEERRHNPFVRG